jgi:hypothetical protein
MQTVSLEYPLAGEQPAGYANTGVSQEGSGHQQQAEGCQKTSLLEHGANENGAKEGAAHITHEDFCRAPIPKQKAKQSPHQGPQGWHTGKSSSGKQHGHGAAHQAVETVHEINEINYSGGGDQKEQKRQPASRKGRQRTYQQQQQGSEQLHAIAQAGGQVIAIVQEAH